MCLCACVYTQLDAHMSVEEKRVRSANVFSGRALKLIEDTQNSLPKALCDLIIYLSDVAKVIDQRMYDCIAKGRLLLSKNGDRVLVGDSIYLIRSNTFVPIFALVKSDIKNNALSIQGKRKTQMRSGSFDGYDMIVQMFMEADNDVARKVLMDFLALKVAEGRVPPALRPWAAAYAESNGTPDRIAYIHARLLGKSGAAFLLGTHPRVGQDSSIYRAKQDWLYEPRILHRIMLLSGDQGADPYAPLPDRDSEEPPSKRQRTACCSSAHECCRCDE